MRRLASKQLGRGCIRRGLFIYSFNSSCTFQSPDVASHSSLQADEEAAAAQGGQDMNYR